MSEYEILMDALTHGLVSSGTLSLRLGDLGHAILATDISQVEEGQTRYCPLELIEGSSANGGTFDLYRADIFSLGATVYELCLGRKLADAGEEFQMLRRGQLDSYVTLTYSTAFINQLSMMMHPNPAMRPNAAAVAACATHNLSRHLIAANVSSLSASSSSDNLLEVELAALKRENEELRRMLRERITEDEARFGI